MRVCLRVPLYGSAVCTSATCLCVRRRLCLCLCLFVCAEGHDYVIMAIMALCLSLSLSHSAPLSLCACGCSILTLKGACACGHVVIVFLATKWTMHCCSRLRPLCSSQSPPARLKARAHPHHTDRVRDGGYCTIGPSVYGALCMSVVVAPSCDARTYPCVCMCRPPCASGRCGTRVLGHVYASPMCVCLPGAHVSDVFVSSCA
jgi:hypothetical protein